LQAAKFSPSAKYGLEVFCGGAVEQAEMQKADIIMVLRVSNLNIEKFPVFEFELSIPNRLK
jgi:hypothetical protein